MDTKIQKMTERLFERIPYSKKTEKAKEKIALSLCSEYEKELAGHSEMQALGAVMMNYGTVEKAAALAGYSESEVAAWTADENVMELSSVKKAFRKARIYIYLLSFSFTAAITYLCSCILLRNPFFLLFAAAASVFVFLFFRGVRRLKKKYSFSEIACLPDAHTYLLEMSDKYGKRLLNGLMAAILLFFYMLFVVIMVVSSHMKSEETMQFICGYLNIFNIAIYISVKNVLCKRFVDNTLSGGISGKYKSHLLKISASALGYWTVIFVLTALLGSQIQYLFNIVSFAAVIYLLLLIIYNFSLRKAVVFENIHINKKRIAAFSLAAVIAVSYQVMKLDSWLIQPYISGVSAVQYTDDVISYDENSGTGIYTITSQKEDFKILQLTDIHLGGSAMSAQKDLKALSAVYDLIEYTKPDLVIVTGDLVFPMGIMSFSMNNYTPIIQFASFMRNIGIPWAFVYGNHDSESMAIASAEDLNELFQSLSYKNSQTLLYPYIQPKITGRNNQIIEIRNADGSLRQALFLMDSNAYTGDGVNDYDYIHDDQVEWYAENVKRLTLQEGKTVSSMVFFHMPLQEYRDAYELYEAGSDEVRYFFGENGETMINKVCCSDHPSKLFDTAVQLGSTKAMFCGHDHYNNLSVAYKGIRLTYGMSIDYLAMPGIEKKTEQRGGTVITLHSDFAFEIEQIKLTNIKD